MSATRTTGRYPQLDTLALFSLALQISSLSLFTPNPICKQKNECFFLFIQFSKKLTPRKTAGTTSAAGIFWNGRPVGVLILLLQNDCRRGPRIIYISHILFLVGGGSTGSDQPHLFCSAGVDHQRQPARQPTLTRSIPNSQCARSSPSPPLQMIPSTPVSPICRYPSIISTITDHSCR